jgi:hypothetical protein
MGRAKRNKRRSTPKPDNFIGNALINEHDRGCVLVGGAYIEYRLEELLRLRLDSTPNVDAELIEIVIGGPDNSQALLYSGWSKAVILHLVGVIDREHFALFNQIRKLRNHFAHTAGQTLLDEEAIGPILEVLTPNAKQRIDGLVKAIDGGLPNFWTNLTTRTLFSKPRIIFMQACLELNAYIVRKMHDFDPTDWDQVLDSIQQQLSSKPGD